MNKQIELGEITPYPLNKKLILSLLLVNIMETLHMMTMETGTRLVDCGFLKKLNSLDI